MSSGTAANGNGAGASPRSAHPLLVCFSHLRWDFVWQRPQHLLGRAGATFDVLFVEEPIIRDGVEAHLDISTRGSSIRGSSIRVAVPVLPQGIAGSAAITAQARLIGDLLADEPAVQRVFWYYTPMAVPFTRDLAAALVIYDNMDELSAFRGASPEMLANEAALFERADLVFTGGMSLYEAKRGRHACVHAFPSSIDAAHFARARRPGAREAGDQAEIPHPRIGFFGVIDERMDLAMVDAVARARPDWHLVMVGPVVKIDPTMLPRRANLHWLGPRRYEDLPAVLAGWQAGLMPFAMNESTRFISPTKTPEYLAAGVPLVSTPIADVVRPYGEAGLVEIAHSPEEAVAKLDMVMGRERETWLSRVDQHLAGQSWDITWAQMLALIAPGLAGDAPLRSQRAFASAARPG